MAYKIIEQKASEVKIEITIEAEKLKKVTELVTTELAQTVKIDGFRPGKAPQLVIEKEVGKDRFWAEVMDKAIPEAFYEVVVKEKLVTISQPKVEVKSFVPGQSLVFVATVAVLPEIKDLKYKGFKIKETKTALKDAEVEKALDELAKRMTKEVAVTRAAKMGDKVEIDFEGTLKSLPFDGGTSKNHPVVLGSKTLIPGFEEKLVGHKSGESFEIKVKFPADYHAKNLTGQNVEFKIKMNSVLELKAPAVDAELAKNYGFADLAQMREEVKKEMAFQKELEEKRKTEDDIIAAIIEKNKIEAPEILVEEQIHQMVHEAEHNLSHSGLTMEKFLEMSKKTLAEIEAEMKPEAERRVKVGVLFGEIAKLEKIEVTEAEINAEIEKMVGFSDPSINKDDIKAAYETPEKRREIGNNVIIKKTVEKLWEYNIIK